MKTTRDKYKIIITETKNRNWKKKAFDSTVRFDSKVSDLNSYLMEHSPIRVEEYCIEMKNIPVFVSTHYCRHKIGVEHFCLTQREDRINKAIQKGSSSTYKGFTGAAFREIFTYEDGKLFWRLKPSNNLYNIGDEAGSIDSYNRCCIQYSNKRMKRSVIIFMMHHNYRPPVVDHKDMDTLNDKIKNLRPSTTQLNAINTPKKANTLFKGVHLIPKTGNYISRIQLDGEKINLGTYEDPVEAAIEYDKKALELFGDYAYLNFPDKKDTYGGRWYPTNHTMFLNAESLITMAAKRLCLKSHKETVYIMSLIKKEIEKINPELAMCMVPMCVRRNGLCIELKNTCGFKDSIMEKYSYYKELFV